MTRNDLIAPTPHLSGMAVLHGARRAFAVIVIVIDQLRRGAPR